jgi:hypothetical protein
MEQELTLAKFIPFSKVDSVRREVSGIVTAEVPDKDREVCDYEKSKPYYQQWSDEFKKSTDGVSLGNLREMHQLSAVGKATDLRFNDQDKEIEMTFKVVDDDAWKKCEERVYTGFSQGGRKVGEQKADPVFKGCVRYTANPAEVSLVDNPCLGVAHFAYVKADGSIEMRKFLKTEVPESEHDRIQALEQEVSLLKAATIVPITTAPTPAEPVAKAETKTKRVGGKDLPASSFAYVGDPDKTETWKFPIHDAAHARNALARFNQAKGIPASAKGKVRSKIVAAAKKFGIEVSSDSEKVICQQQAAIFACMRKAARVYVNGNLDKVGISLQSLDSDMGKLAKGMYEVSRLAGFLEDLSWMVFAVANEQDWELDEESALPQLLAENVEALTETFLEMVDEETRELLEHVRSRVA